MKMGQAIYSQEQAAGAAGAGEGPEAGAESGPAEDVVDAEFSEVDEDAKG
jgi:molecular chaperone DnaK